MRKKVCIIGLGYVGLPLACLCTRKGHDVTGIDINSELIGKINSGISPIQDGFLINEIKELQGILKVTNDGSAELQEADVTIICVPTPIDNKFHPNLAFVESASEMVSRNLKEEQLVILESTVHPGTTEKTVKVILQKSGKRFYLAHCPERIDPGNKKWPLEKIPRSLGALSKEGAEKAKAFYSSIIDAEITILKGTKEAEATKVMENTFRDINIAFMNEMAKSFDKAGIDIMEVIKGASTKPFAFMPHYPGCGVGGHCIPIDPYYLIEGAKEFKFEHRFLELARKINEGMPSYTISLLTEELNKLGSSIFGSKIGLYGLAYKKNIDDIRESPAFEIKSLLLEKGANLLTYDPYLSEKSDVNSLSELLEKVDFLVIATDHSEIKEIELEKLKKMKVIVDGRNCLDREKLNQLRINYKGIGC